MSRYKTERFDKFNDGEQCDLIERTEESFERSNGLAISAGKIKLGKNNGGVLLNTALSDYDIDQKLSFLHQNGLYVFASDGANCIIKVCNVITAIVTTVSTLPDSGNETFCFIKFRGLVICSYINNANAANICKYSTNGMVMTAWSDTNLIALIGDHKILDYKIIHDRLYVLCDGGQICYSDDGITFVLLVALDTSYTYKTLEYLNGYLYVANQTPGSVSGLVRVSLTGDIQNEVVSLGSITYFSHRVFAGNSYILVNQRYLYRIDGDALTLIFYFDSNVAFMFSPEFVETLFFYNYTDDEIQEMNVDEKISRSYKVVATTTEVFAIHKYDENRTLTVVDVSGTVKISIYDSTHIASGDLITYIFKKGLVTPKQLILYHDFLSTNSWVKVYVKFDQASAWGSAVIDSAVDGSVSKKYKFPVGTLLNFIQFKIEYGTDSSSETPENAFLDFIYLPLGLANSK